MTARFPKPPFDITRLERYHPPMTRTLMWFGAMQFALLFQGVALFLWYADSLPASQSAIWLGVLATGLWAVGAALQGRLSMTEVLLIEAAALATATSVLGLVELHRVFKPLALCFALVFVAACAYPTRATGRFDLYLLAGLAFSLAGDVFLMFPGFFIPGLLSFLVAHLFYIALFKLTLPWFPSRRALMATLAVGALMYAVLFDGLNPVLRFAVAAYVIVIALMAAQAIGRATVLGDRASLDVAIGAGFFMLSDALLATNRFATPLPMAQLWVLSTYYLAQVLIVHNARPATSGQRAS